VGEAEIRETFGEGVGLTDVGVVEDGPAGKGLAVNVEWPGEVDQVCQDPLQGVVAGGMMQEVGTDAGQTVEQVVLGEGGEFAAVDTGLGEVDAAASERSDRRVNAGEGGPVPCGSVGLGGVEHEGERGGAEEEAGVVGRACSVPGGLPHPGVRGLPAPRAGVGAFDVQQRDTGGAFGQGLCTPELFGVRRSGHQ
jgi:hypothetical protein